LITFLHYQAELFSLDIFSCNAEATTITTERMRRVDLHFFAQYVLLVSELKSL